MAQTSTVGNGGNALQSPATPSHQLGVMRGPKRTPVSHSKKPYSRPLSATKTINDSDIQAQDSSGFLNGMRSLVARLWGTSLRSSSSVGPSEQQPKDGASATIADSSLPLNSEQNASANKNADLHLHSESASSSSGAATDNKGGDKSALKVHPATINGFGNSIRSRRPTAESLFASSPYANNKRLASATSSVANLREIERVKNQQSGFSRRHSLGRVDSLRPWVASTSATQQAAGVSSSSHNTITAENARRLLSTLQSISTPLLDARNRVVSGGLMPSTTGVSSETQMRGAISGSSKQLLPPPTSLRRLPVSLLALGNGSENSFLRPFDEPSFNKTSRSRRGSKGSAGSGGSGGHSKDANKKNSRAPSLARTIQMQQARKAVSDRLFRHKLLASTVSRATNTQLEDVDSAAHEDPYGMSPPPRSGSMECEDGVAKAGVVHQREEYEDEDMEDASKRRRAEDGKAVKVTEGMDLDKDEPRVVYRRIRVRRRPRRRTRRYDSEADRNIKWQFSARFDPVSDDDNISESSSDEDDDRAALTAKVPAGKIRGGELIGLSLRPRTGVSNSTVGTSVRSTGFGSNRRPIPIFSAPEPVPVSVPISKTTVSEETTTKDTGVLEPKIGFSNIKEPSAEAKTDKKEATTTVGPNLFGGLTSKPLNAALTATTKAATPVFSFGKPKTNESPTKQPEAADNASEATTAPTTPVFSFSKPTTSLSIVAAPTASNKKDKAASKEDEKNDKSTTPFLFGKPAATNSTSATGATTPEMPAKPVTAAPTFSFVLDKSANDTDKEKDSTTALGTSTAAAPSKPTLFGFGSTSEAGTEKTKPAPTIKFNFGSATSGDDNNKDDGSSIKRTRGDTEGEPESKKSMPAFSLGTMTTPLKKTTPPFDLLATPVAASKTTALSNDQQQPAASSSSGGGLLFGNGGFSFGSPTPTSSAAAAASTSLSTSTPFNFGGASTSSAAAATVSTPSSKPTVAAPIMTIDTTMSDDNDGSAPTTSAATIPSFTFSTAAKDNATASDNSGFNFGASSGGFGASKPFATATTAAPAPAPASGGSLFGGFGNSANNTLSAATGGGGGPAAKRPMFNFGTINTPSAASFETTTVPTPAVVTAFGTSAAPAAATPSFGAPAATPSSFNFAAASTPAGGTPTTASFNFGNNKPSLPPSNTFGSISSQLGNSPFGSASATQISGGGTGGGSSGLGFGNSSTTNLPSNNSSSGMFGFGSGGNNNNNNTNPAASGGGFGSSSGAFNFASNASTNSGFGEAFTGGFGQQSAQTTNAFNNPQPSGGFGASSNTSSVFAGGSTAPGTANTNFTFEQSSNNGTPSTAGFQLNGSTPVTPFGFASNTSVQGGGGHPFQFNSGSVNQQSNTGGGGGMTIGRVGNTSNVSTSSHGRRIARPRARRH